MLTYVLPAFGRLQMNRLVIQVVGADPYEDTPEARLELGKEFQAIQRVVEAQPAQKHQVHPAPAARLSDVIRVLQNKKPNCVHFTCHGTQFSRIVLLDEKDEAAPVSHLTIGLLFNALSERIRLVVLSCCYSAEQAERIAEIIDCVVGIEGTVDAKAAAAYSVEFYRNLANDESVARAHELALITFSDHNKQGGALPKLYPRSGVDPAKVFPGRTAPSVAGAARPNGVHTKKYQQAKRVFEENRQRYGVWADESIIKKAGLIDGSSAISYRIEKLRTIDQKIRKVYFDIDTMAGLVGQPGFDSTRGTPSLEWKPAPSKEPGTIKGRVDQLSSTRGHFVGNLPLGINASGTKGTYSFGWTVPILNCDAVTMWEFNNLYAKNDQKHVDGSNLPATPHEYFAALVWFPVKKLTIHLSLPQSSMINEKRPNMQPRCRIFRLKSTAKPIPTKDVLGGGTLYLRPNPKSSWNARNLHWEAVPIDHELPPPVLESRPDGTATLTVEYPPMGSYISLDWDVLELEVSGRLDTLIRQTEHVREELLRHRDCRKTRKESTHTRSIKRLFCDLHENFLQKYGCKAGKGTFETTLLVWNDEKKRLEMVEGFVNGHELPLKSWDFWLPFGAGLGGSCFRTANTRGYRRPLDPSNGSSKYDYLPLPGGKPHECLITFPIDHPEFLKRDLRALGPFRSRQLIGVVTIGSTCKASNLCLLCEGKDQAQIRANMKDLHILRKACQATCDNISSLIL